MKKIILAVLLPFALSAGAQAQSSVTLFGVMDVAVRHLDNGGSSQVQLASGSNSPSRFGMRGSEDLGGGLAASFVLDAAIKADDGTTDASRFFGRRATVSLSGSLGELRLGRDRLPTWTVYVDNDTSDALGVADTSRIYPVLGGAQTKIRGDNGVHYFTPRGLGGFYAHAAATAGEGVVGAQYRGARVGYSNAAIDISGAYGETQAAASQTLKVGILAGSYDFKVLRLFAAIQQIEWSTQENRMVLLGARVPVGAGQLRLQYARSDGRGSISDRDADFYAVGYVHPLSKRTALYGTVARTRNKGTANYTTGDIAGATMPAGARSTGFDLGVRHSF